MCEDGIEKSVHRDHHLSSLGKPRDANRRSSGKFFYPTLTLMMDCYTIVYHFIQKASKLVNTWESNKEWMSNKHLCFSIWLEINVKTFKTAYPGFHQFTYNKIVLEKSTCNFQVTILKPTANWSPYIFTLVQKVKRRVYIIHVFFEMKQYFAETLQVI